MRASLTVALLPAFLVLAACSRSPQQTAATNAAPSATAVVAHGGHVMIVLGDDGFSPSEVKVTKGEPLMLMFKRTTEKTCAKAIEFPELKVTKDLPMNEVVTIEVPTDESRTLTFQCGMGMFKSKIVIQ